MPLLIDIPQDTRFYRGPVAPTRLREDKNTTSQKTFAYVGNWSFQPKPQRGKGISIFHFFPESGDLKLIETVRPDVAAGQLCLDAARQILYAVDERGERRGEIGGGGYVMAFHIDADTGELTLIN